MVKIDFNATSTKVYWTEKLFPKVLFLLCGCLCITPHSSATRIPRPVSYGTEAASHTELRGRLNGEDWMASESKKRRARMAFQRVNLVFEQLEARQLMSVSSPAPPPLEHMETAPPLTSNSTPMVYAGQNLTVSQADSATLNGEVLANLPQNMTVTWSLVSGPGTIIFADPNANSTTATFSSAGTYELALTADNNGVLASDRVVVNVTAANVINIDQAWLDQRGSGPYYLDQADYTYILQTDVTTDGTAFAILDDNITFDLNGHTITYDNASQILVENGSFESGTGSSADTWDFTNAPEAERFEGEYLVNEVYDGDFSLRFGPGFNGEQSVVSSGTITLEANTTYSLSAMIQHVNWVANESSFVRLIGQDVADEYELVWNKKRTRSIQLVESVFTTGATGGTYKIAVGADNPDAVGDFTSYIDDIKVQRTKIYGVAVAVKSWESDNYSDISQYGTADNINITNGTIVQGQDGATWSHAIFDRGVQTTVSHSTITVSGASTSAIYGPWASQSVIHHNTLISNVDTIATRNSFSGAIIYKSSGQIYNNVFDGGPQAGIYNSGVESLIYGNQFSIRSKYTNGFAIVLYDDRGSEVFDNTIDNTTGDYAGRGIHVQRASFNDPSNPTIIRNNTVKVREIARNQEYAGVVLGGAYGIQLEAAQDIEVFSNTVDAVADDGDAFAFRMNIRDSNKRNVSVHDNTFRAVRLNSSVNAASLRFHDIAADNELQFENNLLISNRGWIGDSQSLDGLVLTSNELRVEGDGTDFVPVQGRNWGFDLDAREERAIKGINFVDNRYTDVLSQQIFETSQVGNWPSGPETSSWFINSYTTTFQINNSLGIPLANAAVTIVDKDGNEVFAGTSDANGQLSVVLDEFKMHGDVKTEYGPYTITVTALGEQIVQQFSVDMKQTIELTVGT